MQAEKANRGARMAILGTASAARRGGLLALLFAAAGAVAQTPPDPIPDPIPERIVKGQLRVAVDPFVRAPASGDTVRAAIQYLLPIPGPGDSLAFNDTRGILYVTDAAGAAPHVYLDLRQGVGFINAPFGLESGFRGFAFHPQFATVGAPGYGKLYTAFSANPDGAANYAGEGAVQHSVIREWSAEDAAAAAFAGESRELLRVGQFAGNHNVGTIAFNPTAAASSPDHGLLYICFGDGGAGNDPFDNGQRVETPLGAILRIDPLASDAGAYGIPPDNPLVGQPNAAAEVWAWGLRNPQQFSWDAANGRMFIADIGQDQIEEINLGVAGGNYGWRLTEGTFATGMAYGLPRGPVYERSADLPPFEYPVAQYDHGEGWAVAGGFVYRGNGIPALRGKYLFTDIVNGRLFAIDSDDLVPDRPAAIEEVRLTFGGIERDLMAVAGWPAGNPWRVDARLGIDHAGELYLLTKGDGWIRRLAPALEPPRVQAAPQPEPLAGEDLRLSLASLVAAGDAPGALRWQASSSDESVATVRVVGSELVVEPKPAAEGATEIVLVATDSSGLTATVRFEVRVEFFAPTRQSAGWRSALPNLAPQ